MIKQFAQTPWQNTRQHEYHIGNVIRYLKRKVMRKGFILDVGEQSPLTVRIRKEFENCMVLNIKGDLDVIDLTSTHPLNFPYVLYSHTIEHQFNPLHTLLELRKEMTDQTVMFIILPRRGKLLWDRGHYHEIDHYRMKLLLQRAGYEIISYELHKGWRHWCFYLTGIRPLLRLFFEFNAYYEVRLQR